VQRFGNSVAIFNATAIADSPQEKRESEKEKTGTNTDYQTGNCPLPRLLPKYPNKADEKGYGRGQEHGEPAKGSNGRPSTRPQEDYARPGHPWEQRHIETDPPDVPHA
jgi:hypothetical protein